MTVYAIDFDGILCEDKYPLIGKPNEFWIEFVKMHRKIGDKFILWTCRQGDKLDEARIWCKAQGLIFDAVNDNLAGNIKLYGANPRKVFVDRYIDDRNMWVIDNDVHHNIPRQPTVPPMPPCKSPKQDDICDHLSWDLLTKSIEQYNNAVEELNNRLKRAIALSSTLDYSIKKIGK